MCFSRYSCLGAAGHVGPNLSKIKEGWLKTGGVCAVCSAPELLQWRDDQTHAYFLMRPVSRMSGVGGGAVIGTDCVLWLRHRVLLGRGRGSIWAEF